MNGDKHILVATDNVADADVVRNILANEFTHIHLSTDPNRAAANFDALLPDVLILAFNAIEKAERYSLALHRDSPHNRSHLYRTLLLCDAKDVQKVYVLCKQSIFDDYVLFWPLGKDPTRLPMAVHHALRSLEGTRNDGPVLRTFAAQARRIAELETLVQQMSPTGGQHSERTSESLERARLDTALGIDVSTNKQSDASHSKGVEIRELAGSLQEKSDQQQGLIGTRLDSAAARIGPVHDGINAFENNHQPPPDSVRTLKSVADQVLPTVLVVDDDGFQHKVVGRIFAEARLNLVFANSAIEALSILRSASVDVVLLDIEMPGVSGIEMLHQLKSIKRLATIPVIMMTGHRAKDIVLQCLTAGASGYVVKPFEKGELYTKVQKLLKTYKG